MKHNLNTIRDRRRRTSWLTLAFLAAVAFAWPVVTGCTPQDRVVNVEKDNAEMNAAIAEARASLPDFWKVFENPVYGETEFALKIRITDPHGTEHFWATEITRTNGSVHGVINNDPNTVTSVRLGQRVPIPEADISDWLYLNKDQKMVGNRTLRVLLKHMPAQQAEALRGKLAAP